MQFATLAAHEVKNYLDQLLAVDVRGPDESEGKLGHSHGSHQIKLGLKKGFGYFVLLIGSLVLIDQLMKLR